MYNIVQFDGYSCDSMTDVIDYLGCKPGDVCSSTFSMKETNSSFVFYFSSIDPFTRKDWYDIKAPSMFAVRQVGKTLVNRTQGTRKSYIFFALVLRSQHPFFHV